MRRFQDQMVLNKTHQSGSPHNQFGVRAITLKGTIYPSELVNGRKCVSSIGIVLLYKTMQIVQLIIEGYNFS